MKALCCAVLLVCVFPSARPKAGLDWLAELDRNLTTSIVSTDDAIRFLQEVGQPATVCTARLDLLGRMLLRQNMHIEASKVAALAIDYGTCSENCRPGDQTSIAETHCGSCRCGPAYSSPAILASSLRTIGLSLMFNSKSLMTQFGKQSTAASCLIRHCPMTARLERMVQTAGLLIATGTQREKDALALDMYVFASQAVLQSVGARGPSVWTCLEALDLLDAFRAGLLRSQHLRGREAGRVHSLFWKVAAACQHSINSHCTGRSSVSWTSRVGAALLNGATTDDSRSAWLARIREDLADSIQASLERSGASLQDPAAMLAAASESELPGWMPYSPGSRQHHAAGGFGDEEVEPDEYAAVYGYQARGWKRCWIGMAQASLSLFKMGKWADAEGGGSDAQHLYAASAVAWPRASEPWINLAALYQRFNILDPAKRIYIGLLSSACVGNASTGSFSPVRSGRPIGKGTAGLELWKPFGKACQAELLSHVLGKRGMCQVIDG